MASITVYGASDDLIELDGAISEEFPFLDRDDRGDLVAFSDGTILRVAFSASGVWRITPVVEGVGTLTIVQAPEEDDDNYSDRATLEVPDDGRRLWAVHGVTVEVA